MALPLNVLIVEDQRIAARDLSEILTDLGHNVVGMSANAEDAIWLMKIHDPDLVLADIVIEGSVDGISMARMIREEFDAAIIFISSHADTQTVNRASSIRPNGYIVKPFSAPAVSAAVSTAMANFVKEHSDIDLKSLEGQSSGGLGLQAIEHIDDFLDKHFDEDVSVNTLAEVADVPVSTFSRRFKQKTGKSPYQYVVERRINEAKRLLRHTAMPISEISLSVGYSDQAHFSTAFKKINGITPGSYRKL